MTVTSWSVTIDKIRFLLNQFLCQQGAYKNNTYKKENRKIKVITTHILTILHGM
jgi:hypothetical protein